MESSPQFSLRWNNHSFNIIQVFMEQLSSESLVDVTLSCDGHFLKAHKMVLSACSPYFQNLFAIHQVQHPVIIFNGIKFHQLKMIVEFMYRGETRVLDSELNDILAVAETLQIKGLCTVRNKYDRVSPDETNANDNVQMEDIEGQSMCNPSSDVSVSDPLAPTPQSESLKSTRKRKCPPEVKRGVSQKNNSKVSRSEDSTAESSIPEAPTYKVSTPKVTPTKRPTRTLLKASSPKAASIREPSPGASSHGESIHTEASPRLSSPIEFSPILLTPRESSSVATSPRASSPVATSPRASSPEATSPRAPSPCDSLEGVPLSKRMSPKSASPEVTKKSSSPPKLRPAKVYPPKSKAKKPFTSDASAPEEVEHENTEVLPFVQVDMSEPVDDDIDLARTIKVEPLFIRDIDDNDTSWDDPSRLVIDLPPEEQEAAKEESQIQEPVTEQPLVQEFLIKVKKRGMKSPIKTTFVPKAKLKVRPASELVASSVRAAPKLSSSSVRPASELCSSSVRSASGRVSCSQSAHSSTGTLSIDPLSDTTDKKPPCTVCVQGKRIPRPPNAFMVFANEWRKKLALENPTESNKQISVRLGIKWKNLTTEDKNIYFTASRKAGEEHKKKYPYYIYNPKEARLRKSQMQALRQSKFQRAIPPMKMETTIRNNDKDPLQLDSTFSYETSAVLISNITNNDVTVKEELLDDESQPQNLEEEFLKTVEEGKGEARNTEQNVERAGELNSVPHTQTEIHQTDKT